jgi:ABC-type Fe3+ transport system permease subunit
VSTKHAVHLAFCVAAIAFALGLALPVLTPTPVLWYRPADRDWVFDVKTTGVAMDFFGRCLLAAVASAGCGGLTYAGLRWRARRDPSPTDVALFTGWALATVMVAIAFFAWRLAHRELTPPPLPSWYQPR